MLKALIHRAIRNFEAEANYDAAYMHAITDSSAHLAIKFQRFVTLNHHHKLTPNEVLQTARLATMTCEDCGPCLQLCIDMALASGMDPNLVKAAVREPTQLPDDLRRVHDYAVCVATNQPDTQGLVPAIAETYGRDVAIELAMVIATSRVYPALKRGMGHATACALMSFDFERAA